VCVRLAALTKPLGVNSRRQRLTMRGGDAYDVKLSRHAMHRRIRTSCVVTSCGWASGRRLSALSD
jgi:hypothetical protein